MGELWLRASNMGSSSVSSSGMGMSANSTSAATNEANFAMLKSVRTSIIVLASLNVVAALVTVAGVLWDYRVAARRDGSSLRFKTLRLGHVSPAEIFPLVLSGGIVVQGISFAAAQSRGLKAPLALGCAPISQLMLPAIFITPYLQFVFGVETALRSLRLRQMQGRVKWAVSICLVLVGVALLATYVLTFLSRPSDACFASLFWLVQRWKLGCFGLLTAIGVVLLACAGLTFFRLHKNTLIDPAERVAASRMIYYLCAAVISIVLTIPFFFNNSFSDPEPSNTYSDRLAIVASVVYNLSGFTTGGLYFFLRSSTCATIGPRGYQDFDRQELKKGIRVRAPSHYIFNNQIQQPLSPPGSVRKTSGDLAAADKEMDEEKRIGLRDRAPTYEQTTPPKPLEMMKALPFPSEEVSPTQVGGNQELLHTPRDSPAIPSATHEPPAPALSATPGHPLPDMASLNAASPDLLLPPPAIYGPGHRRDSSQVSSATVQIGLRLSNMEDMHPLGSPRTSQSTVAGQMSGAGWPVGSALSSSRKISPLATEVAVPGSDGCSLEESKHKTLPPIPREAVEEEEEEEEQVKLSPTVYTPQKGLPLVVDPPMPEPVASNTPAAQTHAEPRLLGASDSPLKSKKASWI